MQPSPKSRPYLLSDLARVYVPRFALLALVLAHLSGCASMASQGLANSIGQSMVNQDDPATVRAGAPAFLLLIDGLIADNPDEAPLLLAGARLYSAYAGVFVDDVQRARRMSDKALGYARRAVCPEQPGLCLSPQPFPAFRAALAESDEDELELLYTYAVTWLGWIQTHSEDWNAIADLARVEALLERVVALEPAYERGQPHLYLGVLNSLLPPALGGRPEQGRAHFEQAIELSAGRNLMAKVEMARRYARLVFDRPLHDRLLQEVIAAPAQEPGLTLSNVLAKEQAQNLLADSADYFLE